MLKLNQDIKTLYHTKQRRIITILTQKELKKKGNEINNTDDFLNCIGLLADKYRYKNKCL